MLQILNNKAGLARLYCLGFNRMLTSSLATILL